MVFMDTNTKCISVEIGMHMASLGAVAGALDYYEISGLNHDHKMDPKIWVSVKEDSGTSEQERAVKMFRLRSWLRRGSLGDKQWVRSW